MILVSELFQAKVLMVLVHHFLTVENEWAFVYNFFAATIGDNLFDNPVLFRKCWENFLIDTWPIIGTSVININRIQDGPFRGCSRMGGGGWVGGAVGGKKGPPP